MGRLKPGSGMQISPTSTHSHQLRDPQFKGQIDVKHQWCQTVFLRLSLVHCSLKD